MKPATCIVLFFLTAASVFSLGKKQAEPVSNPPDEQVIDRAEQVMKALFAAYPRQIERVEFRNGDWALLLRGNWFYYAGGRILPENLLGSSASINPQPFYNYLKELPVWKTPGAEEAARYKEMASNRNQNPLRRSPHFLDTLWRINSRSEADQRVKTIRFLGKSVNVHYLIMENLALVEEQILAASKTDPQVQAWISGIKTLEGWTWRDIAQTQSRSFHAYGLAVDILPKSLGGKETYWLWAAEKKPEWWNISYNERYHPPAAVIKAFETYGFVWGGKWLFFDTMHFEYRPEILILGGLTPETRR
jgi:hypothetical protein